MKKKYWALLVFVLIIVLQWIGLGFYGAVDGTAAEREPLGKLSGGEVYRIYRWGKAFDGDGHGLHAENAEPHQGL